MGRKYIMGFGSPDNRLYIDMKELAKLFIEKGITPDRYFFYAYSALANGELDEAEALLRFAKRLTQHYYADDIITRFEYLDEIETLLEALQEEPQELVEAVRSSPTWRMFTEEK